MRFYSAQMWLLALTDVGKACLVSHSVQMLLVNWLIMSEQPQQRGRAGRQILLFLIRLSPLGKTAPVLFRHVVYANKSPPCAA